jgi:hypothetical protein
MRKANTGPIRVTEPAAYRIEVQGALDLNWASEFGNLRIEHQQRQYGIVVSTLTGKVRDQAALAGLLDLTFMLGMPLLSVALLGPDLDPH